MDAYRGNVHVGVTKKSLLTKTKDEVVYKMYRNSAQTGTERKGKQNRQNERESERISEDERKESKKLYIHLKRDEIRV